MTDQHPITPPPELIEDWQDEWNESNRIVHSVYKHIAIRAAKWGADQELEATLAEVSFLNSRDLADRIRRARRPKPLSLNKQALQALKALQQLTTDPSIVEPLRRALEALPND